MPELHLKNNMDVQSLFFILFFCLLKRISTEQCETFLYKEPVTHVNTINNGLNQVCNNFNGSKVLYRVVDSYSGEISINVIANKMLCSGEYSFEIRNLNGLHARQKFVIYTDPCRNNSGCIINDNKLQFSTLYVSTGHYYIVIKGTTENWKSENFTITTNYIPFKLKYGDKLLLGDCLITQKNKLEVTLIANETIFLKPPKIEMFVIPPDIAEYSNEEFCYGNYTRSCVTPTDYKHSCIYDILNVTDTYKIYTKIDDLRCDTATLWANISKLCIGEKTCKRKITETPRQNSTATNTQKIITTTIVLLAIIAALIFFLIKKLWIRANNRNRRDSYNAEYSLQNAHDGNEYLIIYARESEEFKKIIDVFKSLLSCENDSKVTTLYELDPRCSNPREWLEDQLQNSNVTVILLLNIAASYACDNNYLYRTSHCFDFLFPYAMELLQRYEKRSYHNLYKVLAPNANQEKHQFVNILTSYILPQHTSKLLSDLKIISSEESRNCEEILKNACNAYYHYIVNNPRYLQDIFTKNIIL